MAGRASIYHTSSYKSNFELKALLQRDVGIYMNEMSYKFYHRGVLGNTQTAIEGIEVRTVLTCVYTRFNTQAFIRETLNPKIFNINYNYQLLDITSGPYCMFRFSTCLSKSMGSNLQCILREKYSIYKGSETWGCYKTKTYNTRDVYNDQI
jgi:hypothetical protein